VSVPPAVMALRGHMRAHANPLQGTTGPLGTTAPAGMRGVCTVTVHSSLK